MLNCQPPTSSLLKEKIWEENILNFISINNQVPMYVVIFLKVINTQSSPLTRRHILRNSCHCCLTKLTVAVLNLSHLETIVLRCKVWAGTYWQLCDLSVRKLCFLFHLETSMAWLLLSLWTFLVQTRSPFIVDAPWRQKKQEQQKKK